MNADNVVTNRMIVIKSVNVVKDRPNDWIGTIVSTRSRVPSENIAITDLINHGRPKHTKMSKMFEPIALHNAISAKPARFTTRALDNSSGNDVPAANNVRPPTVCGTPKVTPN